MTDQEILEIPIAGMDCTECTMHVQKAISNLPGVKSVNVYLASEKAVVELNPGQVDINTLRKAVETAGYSVPLSGQGGSPETSQEEHANPETELAKRGAAFTRQALALFAAVFGLVLFVVLIGEGLGLFETVTGRIPWPLSLAVILAGGYPVFRNVIRATLHRQVISHTLMTVGVLAAIAIGEWATAAVVVLFMRVGDYAERFTTERARRAVRDLAALAPQKARVERNGEEFEIPVIEVQPGETIIVRPGEKIPVDGEVLGGQATIDQSTITGESMPVEAGPGTKVFAATLVRLGSLRLRAEAIGPASTFGRVVRLVEEAESNRADVQRLADRFSALFLPVVGTVACLTLILRRDPMAVAAVLVVACSCSFALATPIAVLASTGAAARRGLLIKGGKYLETLDRADVLLIDKTGTLTLGKPEITNIVLAVELPELSSPVAPPAASPPITPAPIALSILQLAAAAERYSEHPLADAVRRAAHQRGVSLLEPEEVEMLPGMGVKAKVDGHIIVVGSQRMLSGLITDFPHPNGQLDNQGKTTMYVSVDGQFAGMLTASDTLRSEVPAALQAARRAGIRRIELLTGDNEHAAATLVKTLTQDGEGISYRAGLLPEDKIAIVRQYQADGHRVVMVGDGINDAPALAQADVGIAMGAAGSDIAMEAAHIVLMRDDWRLVPEVLRIAHRTMRVIRMNLAFTVVYNMIGLSLAASGLLPPIWAAAAQSLPDLGILANSSRLLKQKN